MLDSLSMKRLGLENKNIDANESYETVDPSTNNHSIFVHLKKDEFIPCPNCGCVGNHINKGSKSQKLKYSTQFENNIDIKLYRRVYICRYCEKYFKEENPFANEFQRVSFNTEIKVLDELRKINETFTTVANRFNLTPTTVMNIFDKRVDLKRRTLPPVLCVDEVYAKKLTYHRYCFIIYAPQAGKILDVLPSRHLDQLENYFHAIDKKERSNVKFFSMDLYENYRSLAHRCFPNALVCADPFHVIQHLSQDFHVLRKKIMNKYSYLKNTNDNYYWLFKSKWKLLTRNKSKLGYKRYKIRAKEQYMSERDIVDYMLSIDKNLRVAYDIYQEYLDFNSSANINNATEWLDELISKYQTSKIPEYIHSWKMLVNWHDEIVNSFNRVNGYRVTNGGMERANGDVKTMFRLAFGAVNFPRMRNRIMFAYNRDSSILYNKKENNNSMKRTPRGAYKTKK